MLGPRLPNREIDRDDSFRLNVPRAPLLAVSPDGGTVVALVRKPRPSREGIAIVGAASLETRCLHALVRGVQYEGLLLGRSGRVYAFGTKPAEQPRRRDAVLTILDAETGAVAAHRTVREALRGRWRGTGTDWLVYGGALSGDERRLVLSYHGHDSEKPERRCVVRRRRRRCGPAGAQVDVPNVHGAVAAFGSGFVAAAEAQGLLRLGRDGREVGRTPVIPRTHLMDFAADDTRPVAYTSTCGPPAIHRIDLARNRQETVTGGGICGHPLAVHEDRFLVLSAFSLNEQREPARFSGRPQRLVLIDLQAPGSAKRVPWRGAPLDAVVVE